MSKYPILSYLVLNLNLISFSVSNIKHILFYKISECYFIIKKAHIQDTKLKKKKLLKHFLIIPIPLLLTFHFCPISFEIYEKSKNNFFTEK